jgi:hypothetical protein
MFGGGNQHRNPNFGGGFG